MTRLVENFLNMRKETATQVQEAETSLLKEINPMRKTLRHILSKLTKIEFKENIKSSKGTAKKQHTRESPKGYQLIWQQKLCRPGGSGKICGK